MGLFYGTMTHQLTGRLKFTDEANKIEGFYAFGEYTFKKQDYVWGEIKQNGVKVGDITGNYCGWLDFDGIRYWDVRESDKIMFPIAGEEVNPMPSHASLRTDGRFFISKTIEEA